MPAFSGSRHRETAFTRSIFRIHPPTSAAVLALLLLALLTAGCGPRIMHAGTSGTRTPATPTAMRIAASPTLPPDQLSWVNGSLPPGELLPGAGESTLDGGVLSISQSDGNIAYACARAASLSVGATIWVTHDRAQHWSRLAPLPLPTIPFPLTSCWIVPDAVDPNIAVAEVSWERLQANGPYYAEGAHVVTFDGGKSWQPLRGPTPFDVLWMATYHGATMAWVQSGPSESSYWISYDQMQTWQTSSAPAPYNVLSINPTTGELLGVGGTVWMPSAGGYILDLATSDDMGLHWTTIATPKDPIIAMVSPPAGSQPRRICVIAHANSQSVGTLMCSMDGGKTWSQRPQREMTYTGPNQGSTVAIAQELAVGPDGTVYADMEPLPNPTTPDTLYRLAPGSDRWQSLGTSPIDLLSPDIVCATADLPGAGILWYARSYNVLQLFNP